MNTATEKPTNSPFPPSTGGLRGGNHEHARCQPVHELASSGPGAYPPSGATRLDIVALRRRLKRAGLTGADLALALNVASRARFAHRFLRDRSGRPWEPRNYQLCSLESGASRKLHCDGRDVGKTAEIEIVASWGSLALPGRQMLIAAQCEANLSPLMERVFRTIETTPELRANLSHVRRSPSWHMLFRNGHELWGRIAGAGGVNFHGMHVDWCLVDEAQNMLAVSWRELYQAVNTGGVLWVYGVPNGLRNEFYRMSRDPAFEQYNWPSTLNPSFTLERDAELIKFYDGRASQGYVHNVLGQHGSPERAVFNMEHFARCESPGFGLDVALRAVEDIPDPPPIEGLTLLGADLGYANDPTELAVYESIGDSLQGIARFRLARVDYATQEDIIEALDERYRFAAIALDAGHAGLAVAHGLAARGPHWADRVLAVNFGGSMPIERRSGEPLDGAPRSRPVKEVLTERLSRMMAAGRIRFGRTSDRYLQYANHTYSIGANGRIVYSKGDDHIIDADRCAVYAWLTLQNGHGAYFMRPALVEPF